MRSLARVIFTGAVVAASWLSAFGGEPRFIFRAPKIAPPIPEIRSAAVVLVIPKPGPSEVVRFRIEPPMCCGGVFDLEEESPLGLLDLFGSVENFRHVLATGAVEVVELRPTRDRSSPALEYADRVAKLDECDSTALRKILTNDSNFDWRENPGPESRAEFRVKFKGGSTVVELDLFLADGFVRLVQGGVVGPAVRVDGGRAEFWAILERYFPGVTKKG